MTRMNPPTGPSSQADAVVSSTEDVPPTQLHQALNRAVYYSLRYVALGFAILCALLAIFHGIVLDSSQTVVVVGLSGGTAVISFGLYVWLHRRRLSPRWAHPLGAFFMLLAQANGLSIMYLSGQLQQTINIIFVVLALGLLFLDRRWLFGMLLFSVISWIVMAFRMSPSFNAALVHYAFAIGISAFFSIVIWILRRRTLERYENLRYQDVQQRRALRHQTQQLETSIAVGQRLTSILDLDTVLTQVVELIKEQYGYYFIGVFLLDETGQYAVARAGTGELGRRLAERQFQLQVGEEGLIGWVAANGRFANIPDVTQDKRYLRVEDISRTRSELDLPLTMGDELLGVLTLQSKRPSAFPATDIPFLQLLADQVAIAIHNAAEYEGERLARQLAETLQKSGRALTSTLDLSKVLDRILAELADIVAYDRGSVLAPEGDELVMIGARGFPTASPQIRIPIGHERESIYKQIYETQRPLPIPDVTRRDDWQQVDFLPPTRSWLGLPLIHRDTVIGMFSLARETLDPYSEDEIALATAFAGQAAVALRNAQLYDKVNEFNRQMEYEVRNRTIAIQEAYERLEQLDRTKSDFISIASHELRTPLTILRGYSQMLLKEEAIRENNFHHNLVNGIFEGARRMHEIVNSMADMAKIDSRSLELLPEPVSLEDLIRELCRQFTDTVQEREITLTIEDLSHVPPIEADPEALQKVFYHLIVNAIKYTPDGGEVTVGGERLQRKGLDLPDEGVEIVVSDTGIGIDPDLHDLIFTKFYQTGEVALHSTGRTKFKGGGPGLGLAIARGIVVAHHGEIWVESDGHDEQRYPGSDFHVVLPLRQG